jgi:hypothetical protein
MGQVTAEGSEAYQQRVNVSRSVDGKKLTINEAMGTGPGESFTVSNTTFYRDGRIVT